MSAPRCLGSRASSSMGQREDDVEVRHGQQLSRTRGQPLGTRVALALGAVSVTARVVRDGLMAAADALIAVTAPASAYKFFRGAWQGSAGDRGPYADQTP